MARGGAAAGAAAASAAAAGAAGLAGAAGAAGAADAGDDVEALDAEALAQGVHESPFPGSRLMIRELVLENFKSYAGEVRIGPFHKCFSSIVGPNGSGKSNTIDAMLFVFGKRAKKLRLSKVSELIHSSSQHPNCEFARVTVHFQNIVDRASAGPEDEGFDVVPGSALEVTRVAYQSNKSEYFVDGRRQSFTEVARLLMARGVDLANNRFLILQGEVEQISLMKPKAPSEHEDGLLEYLEDIIGSNRFLGAITRVSAQVEQLSEQRAERLNRVKVVEKDKEALQEARDEAVEYVAKDRALTQKRAWLLQARLVEASAELAAVADKRAALEARLAEESAAQAAENGRARAAEAELARAEAGFGARAEALAERKKALQALERKDVKLREDLKHLAGARKEVEAAAAAAAKAAAKAEQARGKAEQALPGLEAEAAALKAQRAAAEERLERLQGSLAGEAGELRAALEQRQEGLAPLSAAASQARSRLDVLATEMELLREPAARARAKLEQLREQADALEAEVASKPREAAAAEQDLARVRADLHKALERLAEAEAGEKDLEARLREGRCRHEAARAAQSAAASQSGLVRALLEARAAAGSPIAQAGFHGRRGDLGSIEARFDVAASTACGAGLDFLVTDSTRGAEACVKMLREQQLGRATFAILDKIAAKAPPAGAPAPAFPEGVPRLFDLVRVHDARLRDAFYHVMRDTLVAQDLDQAVRIAYQGSKCVHRVVTLAGQLIDTSGTMSGGGQRVKRGAIKLHKGGSSQNQQDGSAAAGEEAEAEAAEQAAARGEQQPLLLSKEQLAQLDQSNAALQARLADVRAQRARALKDRQSLERAAEDLEGMLPKMALELEERAKQLKLVRAAAEELAKSVAAAAQGAAADGKQQLAELEKRHAVELKAHQQAQANLAKLEAETAGLHARIAEVGGPKLRAHKEELAQLEAAAEKTRKAISKQAAEVKAQAAKRDKAHAQEQEASKEAQEAAARAEVLKDEAKALEDEALGVMQAFEQAKAEEEASKVELAAAQTAAAELKGRSSKAEKAIVEMRNQLKDYDEHDVPKKKQVAAVLKTALAEAEQHWDLMLSKHGEEAAQALAEREEGEEQGEGAGEGEGEGEKGAKAERQEQEQDHEMLEVQQQAHKAPAPRKRPLLLEPEQLAQLDLGLVAVEVDRLEEAVSKLKKVVNMGAIKEYAAREKEYAARVVELDAVTAARDVARDECEALRKQRLTEFMAGFSTITLRLKEMYQMITLGGDAELELVDSCDPFSEGIVFSVRPPKKSWKQIALLSGGEKTLSSLALIFALHHFKPNALYCLDEVDAALDFKNVSIVANYIKERTQNAQFIVISLRNNMFELADRLVGIYKTHDATKSITISPALVVAAAAAQEKHDDKPPQHAPRRAPLQPINH